MKLYELSEKYQALQDLVDDDAEGFGEAVAETLGLIEADFAEKAEAVMAVAKSSVQHVPAIDAEIKRLQAMKKSALAKEEWLRNYLRENMEATGITKIECPLFKVTLGKPSKVVKVIDESILPEEAIKITRSVDKTALKKLLEAGEVEGAELVDGKSRLLIK